jgi:hypothetical protein
MGLVILSVYKTDFEVNLYYIYIYINYEVKVGN